MSDSAHAELRDVLAAVRRRWTSLVWLQWTGRTAALAAVPLLAAALLWSVTTPGWPVSGLAAAGAVVCIMTIVSLAWRARERRPDDRRLARFIEEAASRRSGLPPSDAIASAVDVTNRAGAEGPFDRLIIARAVSDLRSLDPADVVVPTAWRRTVIGAAGGLTLLGAGMLGAAPLLRAGAGEAWVRVFPQHVHIAVLGGDLHVPAGEPVSIRAAVTGPGARWLPGPPMIVITTDGGTERLAMAPSSADGTFGYQVEAVTRSFTYHVTAARAASSTYQVTALQAPRVRRIDVHYSYPRFTRLKPRHEEDGGDIYGPAGTEVRLLVHTDAPVVEGTLARGAGGPVPLAPRGATTLSADLVLAQDDTYRVALIDPNGLRSNGETEYFIRVMTDRPPAVRIVRPAADRGITPLQEVVIEARADDDYGIEAFDLVLTVAGRAPRTVPFERVDGGATDRSGTYTLEAESLGVQPGDVITYFARARDVPQGRRSVETRSEIFFLDVQPFSETFAAAESRGAGGAGATPLDGLIAAQKEVISATWNLERRAQAGRSRDDVRAVERAQRELRARAERMQGAAGRRRPGIVQQIRALPSGRGAGSPDHVALALEAMDRAAEQLSTARTADAIPHELSALRALLQAQAEIRRRQVMQQASSGGGGGSGRADRDLSALFDRELQRQQETRYEVPPGRQEDEPEPPGEQADRVRELARRQADLARRQRELTGEARSAEELKRELARLSREQEELRRQTEALGRGQAGGSEEGRTRAAAPGGGTSRHGPQRGSAGGRSSDAPGNGGGSAGAMERAAEAMERAVSEMRGESPERAAAHGAQAAEALRQHESELRGRPSDSRPRTAGGDGPGKESGDLDRALKMRDELNRLERQVRDAEAQLQEAVGPSSARGSAGGGRSGAQGDERAAREALQRAREAYARALERTRSALARVHDGLAGATPEHHEFSRASPGTEAFKQDLTEWESLRERVDLALEQYERAAAQRPPDRDSRLNAGASDRVPGAYRTMVSRYFEAIARTAK